MRQIAWNHPYGFNACLVKRFGLFVRLSQGTVRTDNNLIRVICRNKWIVHFLTRCVCRQGICQNRFTAIQSGCLCDAIGSS